MTDRDLVPQDRIDPSPARPRGKTYLLAIAINAYQQCTPLSNAVLDVETFIELMCSRYQVEREQVHFIWDTAATKKGIENAFLRLIKIVTPQDNLIVYFSGHGRYDEHYGGNWVPVEAGTAEEDWPDYLSNDQVKSYLARIKSFHTFLIADSCFSGALFAEKGKDKNLSSRVDTEPSRWALTSGKKEIVSDGEPGAHSPFASALLDVLRKAQEPLPVLQLCGLVLEKVAANAQQTPLGSALAVAGHQGGQLVLYLREDEDQAWAAAQASATLAAYTAYCEQYPQGKYRQFALAKIDKLEEQSEWDKVRKNRLGDLLRYVAENPHSPFVAAAQRLIADLKAGIAVVPPVPTLIDTPPPKIETPSLIIPEHMVFVKGGTFEMGDVMGDKEQDRETIGTVTLSDFMIGKYAVTFEEYDAFCCATQRELPSDAGWGRGQRPVMYVNWYDAIDYCNWRSVLEGLDQVYKVSGKKVKPHWQANGYRLPTEAEWEYAARGGGQKVRFGNGKNIADPKEINFDASESYKQPYSIIGEYRQKTVPVGSLNSPNALGLHDMSGNVWEWCGDWYSPSHYRDNSINPKGSSTGGNRVVRGGSWSFSPYFNRVASRYSDDPLSRRYDIGFRLVSRRPITL